MTVDPSVQVLIDLRELRNTEPAAIYYQAILRHLHKGIRRSPHSQDFDFLNTMKLPTYRGKPFTASSMQNAIDKVRALELQERRKEVTQRRVATRKANQQANRREQAQAKTKIALEDLDEEQLEADNQVTGQRLIKHSIEAKETGGFRS